jgi:hypothetical protein
MPAIASTSGRLHSEFVCPLFLQSHRETDRFFSTSGVQFPHSTSGQFHCRHTVFSSQLKSKIGNILVKTTSLRITLDIDGSPLKSRSHTHPSRLENNQKGPHLTRESCTVFNTLFLCNMTNCHYERFSTVSPPAPSTCFRFLPKHTILYRGTCPTRSYPPCCYHALPVGTIPRLLPPSPVPLADSKTVFCR